MTRVVTQSTQTTTSNIITTANETPVDVRRAKVFSCQVVATVGAPSAAAVAAGVAETAVVTFAIQALTTAKDYVTIYDATGAGWAIYADPTGSTVAPAGAIYTAVASAKKNKANISSDTTAAQVAARFVAAFNALTGFTSVVTLTDNSDGTVTYALATRGIATDAVSKTGTDSGAGSMTVGSITQGVNSAVNTTADSITKTTHGLVTGLKVAATSTGTLPAGLSVTNYWVIKIDANTFQLASSLANALLSTQVDITGQGTSGATHSFTPAALAGCTVVLQKSNDYNVNAATGTWDSIGSPTSIAASGDTWLTATDPEYAYVRVQYAITAGILTSVVNNLIVKGDIA